MIKQNTFRILVNKKYVYVRFSIYKEDNFEYFFLKRPLTGIFAHLSENIRASDNYILINKQKLVPNIEYNIEGDSLDKLREWWELFVDYFDFEQWDKKIAFEQKKSNAIIEKEEVIESNIN